MKKNTQSFASWTVAERSLFAELTTPFAIQSFLDSIPYCGDSLYRCPREVILEGKGHCYDGAVFAAAALAELGYPPIIMELIPNKRDDDHIIALFQYKKSWGAVAKSNYSTLRYREPVYHSLRELVMSYFEGYFNIKQERTLRGYGDPLWLGRHEEWEWRIKNRAMNRIAAALGRQKKNAILDRSIIRKLTPVDDRLFQAGTLGLDKEGVFSPKM